MAAPEISSKFQPPFQTSLSFGATLPSVPELDGGMTMTISCLETPEARHDDGRLTNRRSWGSRAWLSALISGWTRLNDVSAARLTLDNLSEGQLEDIGMRRIGRGVRWLDFRETPLCADFEYRDSHADRTDGGPRA